MISEKSAIYYAYDYGPVFDGGNNGILAICNNSIYSKYDSTYI